MTNIHIYIYIYIYIYITNIKYHLCSTCREIGLLVLAAGPPPRLEGAHACGPARQDNRSSGRRRGPRVPGPARPVPEDTEDGGAGRAAASEAGGNPRAGTIWLNASASTRVKFGGRRAARRSGACRDAGRSLPHAAVCEIRLCSGPGTKPRRLREAKGLDGPARCRPPA